MKIHCILLLSIMLPAWTLSACGTGTLQCSSSDVPTVCDFTQNYVLEGGSCKVKKVDGCEIASFDSSNAPCFLCEKGKVLDENSELCVNVETEKVVQNCFRYDKSSSDCMECDTDYFLNGSTCSAVGNIKVENCALYSSITQCKTCDSGYYLVENECVKIEAVSNCRVHSNRKCTTCDSNYFLNVSYTSNPPAANVDTFDLFASGNYDMVSINLDSNVSTVCQKVTVKHCLVLETAHTCSKCESDYFLTSSKTCERNPELPISNCLKYKSRTVCSECVENYYVTLNTSGVFQECTKIPVIEFCETYDKTNGFCTACAAGYWLNTTLNSCVQRSYNPYPNCQEMEPHADECKTCLTNYTRVTNKTGCLANITNCQTVVISDNVEAEKHVCTLCDDTHYLVNQLCQARTVDGCGTYIDHRNACETCLPTHYINDAKDTCTILNIPFCKTYTTDDLNTCGTCQSLKKPSSDKSACEDITNLEFCMESNGLDDNCLFCNPDKLLVAGACTGSKTETNYDSNCASSNSATDDSACGTCKTNFTKAVSASGDHTLTPVLTDAEMQTKNCYKIKNDADECQQCNENFFVNGAGACVEDPTPTTSPCFKLKSSATGTETLAVPGDKCETCRANLGYSFSTSAPTTCAETSKIAFYIGCNVVNSVNESCNECQDGSYSVRDQYPFCAKETFTPTKFATLITKCAVRLDFDKCHICEPDRAVSSDGSSCDLPGASEVLIENTFDLKLNQKGSAIATEITNCQHYIQINETDFMCSQCDTGYVGIIPQGDATKISAKIMNLGVGYEYYRPFEKCVDKNLMYKTAAGVDHVGADDCMFAIQMDNSGYGCMRCVAGKIGTLLDVTKLNDNSTNLSGTTRVIGNCVSDTSLGLGSDYIGFSVLDDAGGLLPSSVSAYSNCSTNSDHVVFYMYEWSPASGVTLHHSSDGTNPNKIAYCGAVADVLNDVNEAIENCAVYTFSTTVPSTFVQGTNKISAPNCLTCKPGFYVADSDTSKGATSCLPIHGCNTAGVAGNNKWMSGCSHPDSGGWKGKLDNGNYTIQLFDPMPNYAPYKIDNCLMLDQAESKCIVCAPGFTATSSGCESVSSANSDCATSSLGYTGFNDSSTHFATASNKSRRYTEFAYIRQLNSAASSYSTFSNSFCQACDTGFNLMVSSDNQNVCSKRIFKNFYDENCLKYSTLGCSLCKPGFAYDISRLGKCEMVPSNENCLFYAVNSSTCSQCRDGFEDVGGLCTETNCLEKNSSDECVLCKPNMTPHSTSNKHCVSDVPANEECETFSPKFNGYCVKCKDSSKFPYNFISNTTPTFQHHACVPGTFPTNGWKNLNLDYWFVKVTNNNGTVTKEVGVIPTESRTRRMKDSTSSGDPSDDLCIPTRSSDLNFCSTKYEDVICASCDTVANATDALFVPLNNNTCSNANSISGCKNINPDRIHCDTCHTGYFKTNGNKSCQARVLSVNCDSPTVDADTCVSCVAKQFVKNSSDICVAYTAEHCKVLDDTEDKCFLCLDNAWMDKSDGDKCKPTEDVQCVLMKSFENECQKCNNGFYLKTNGLVQTCEAVTAENCSTNHTHKDECLTCKDKFWFNGSNLCVANTEIDFCITYSKEEDECFECNEGYYSTDGFPECRKYPTGIENCNGYSSETVCTSCLAGFYLKENACLQVTTTIADCETYDSESTCAKCISGHFPTSNTRCDEHDPDLVPNCEVFESFEKCKTCKDTFILNTESKLCEESGIAHCLTATRGSPNLCQVCDSGYFPSSNRQTCESPSVLIDNCLDYETQTKCKKCNNLHILSLNGSKCEAIGDKAGENCAVGLEVDKLECDVCEFGYQKNEIGECVKITESYCAFMSGEKCGLCLPKMEMTKEGKCENPNIITEPEFVSVLKGFAYLFTLLIMLR